jgi:hypothetical protein
MTETLRIKLWQVSNIKYKLKITLKTKLIKIKLIKETKIKEH